MALVSACASPRTTPTVLFVCEHGYAKSLVASLHFARMAAARGVRVRAISRGVDPGAEVPAVIRDGLAADGFDVAAFAPQRVTPAELQQADYVVLISVNPDLAGRTARVLRWDDVSPLSEDYARARQELTAHDADLLDSIETGAR
jgi:protein-tyrosine-phosphatase